MHYSTATTYQSFVYTHIHNIIITNRLIDLCIDKYRYTVEWDIIHNYYHYYF